MRTTSKIVLLVTSLVGAAASAQIVTPPPAEARPVDAFVPKPAVRPAAPAQLTPQQMQAANPPPVRAKIQPPTLPDLKWDSLVKRDGEGKLIPLAEPLDLAALRVNPMLKPDTMDQVKPLLADRAAAFERLVIDNLDVVESVDGGMIEKGDYYSKEGLTKVVTALKPLTGKSAPPTLTKELEERKILSPEEAAFNKKIMKEYQDATYPPDKGPETRTPRSRAIIAIIQRASVEESMLTYERLAAEAGGRLGELAKSEGLDAAAKAALTSAAGGVNAKSSAAEKSAAYKKATAGLTLDQRREILRRVAEMSHAGK